MLTSFCQDIYQMLCKKYPNRNIFVIGDQHFFHNNIIKYTRTDFSNVLEMNQYIIKSHNETVNPEDIVIFLGDFCFKSNSIVEILKQLNGHKFLILGNHDKKNIIHYYPSLGFEGVFNSPIKIQNKYLSHEPLYSEENKNTHFQLILNEFKKNAEAINYHGHIHNANNVMPSSFKNCSCEALEYKPLFLCKTIEVPLSKDNPHFINSTDFNEIINLLKTKHNINPNILISDYIYSFILELLSSYINDFFVQGSYGLLKKYNFISTLSDLDISFLYNPLLSRNKHISFFKKIFDDIYEYLKQIDGIDLQFIKRYSSLRMIGATYTSNHNYFSETCLDGNMIFFDCYRETDFINLDGYSLIQKYLLKRYSFLLEKFHFPYFRSKFLTPECDATNLILQVIFQKGYDNKKEFILRKLFFIYNHSLKNQELKDFQDIFVRFFLRNVVFLYTLNRQNEIDYIFNHIYSLDPLKFLPEDFQFLIKDIMLNPKSIFCTIYKDVASSQNSDTFSKCTEIMRSLKK